MEERVMSSSAGACGECLLPVQIDHRRALRARSPGGQAAETLLACHVLHQMTELGRPQSTKKSAATTWPM
jgi:hypothetical protein